jgi:hypothetical protein
VNENNGIKAEIKFLNEKVDLYHQTVMDIVKPAKIELEKTTRDVASLKRDRHWVLAFGVIALGSAASALFDKLFK